MMQREKEGKKHSFAFSNGNRLHFHIVMCHNDSGDRGCFQLFGAVSFVTWRRPLVKVKVTLGYLRQLIMPQHFLNECPGFRENPSSPARASKGIEKLNQKKIIDQSSTKNRNFIAWCNCSCCDKGIMVYVFCFLLRKKRL